MAEYEVVQREAQAYAAIGVTVSMDRMGAVVPPLNDEVFGWLGQRGVAAVGPPLWKYDVISMPGSISLQAGVAIAADTAGDDRVSVGELPAGAYLQTVHRGHPDTLMQATADLLAHAAEQGLRFDVSESPEGERWAARLELYLTDAADEPDLSAWDTMLAFKLAD